MAHAHNNFHIHIKGTNTFHARVAKIWWTQASTAGPSA